MTLRPGPEDGSLEAYTNRLQAQRRRRRRLARRNMELLREKLLPALDHLSEADREERQTLQEFSAKLLASPKQVDVGLVCQIQEALLALARQEGDRSDLIEHLYWLGMGRFSLANKLVNMDQVEALYYARVRECFQEAASYLNQFEEIGDDKTRGYIIRATANRALGRFPTVGERTRRLKEALEVMENPYYRALAPNLPWEQYVKMTHQLMVSSISHSREGAMTGKDVADIMRSVYIVYRDRPPTPRQIFHRSAIEFYCGIHGVDHLLQQLERQIDAADSRDFSPEGMYALISLPAYYCLYLSQYPERMGERERFYVAGLYRRIQSYLDAFPPSQEDENLFFYLRQLICTFIEIDQGIPYRDFLLRLMRHFAPELYVHGCIVAEMAQVLCGVLLDQDDGFFDDIPFIRDISDPDEKRKAVLAYAAGCGLFHDAGKVNCPELHTRTARRWFPVEDEMAQLHTIAGHQLLADRASTSGYAAVALGHHVWYDGNAALSYPAAYRRSQCPEQRIVDVVSLVDSIAYGLDEYWPEPEIRPLFDKAVKEAIALGGRQFSPRVTVLLEEEPVQAALWRAMEDGACQARREIYQRSGK
ncbi:MAG: hypothetical protein HDT37_05705 [Clostridiales bacterium]|nr:hypothetical protein [Clostridiales bacterium]